MHTADRSPCHRSRMSEDRCARTLPRPHAAGHSRTPPQRAPPRGDRVARTTLVEEHMGLVRSIAFRYRGLGVPRRGSRPGRRDRAADRDRRVRPRPRHELLHLRLLARPRRRHPRRHGAGRRRQDSAAACSSGGGWSRTRATDSSAAGACRACTASPRPPDSPSAAVAEALAHGRASLDQPLAEGRCSAIRPARPETLAAAAAAAHGARARALGALRPRQRTIVERHFGIGGEAETLTEIAATCA